MALFKIKYKRKDSDAETEVEIEVNVPKLDDILAAKQLGIAPSQIISIRKK
ncbi:MULTISPECIES: hypothetical protein [Pseudomonas fluorescens group]|uniref:Phage protein n=2 Tax=Pseudomonas fluorescens group TaxID=136843 RepID=A0ABS0US25_9PSED|nr:MULTISPECIES: hypothetical protein [Pseudomonas fluorescens group]MBI6556528.1 hypothetical protein [Pseudomonas veronii]MBI6568392.1 hypothetical protein [Pseudomonas synxantha]MBI6582532.1 hypothetical protein [Pseudomonas synxantha]MBI6647290.1 hypothetical protein [Pseudomonas synxantha]MBI6649126.1 hypothetical protein [Pseudomonas veronii]